MWNLKILCGYVDDMLVLVKEDQIDKILKAQFTVDKFENEDVHFLDLKTMNNGEINIYVKDVNEP